MTETRTPARRRQARRASMDGKADASAALLFEQFSLDWLRTTARGGNAKEATRRLMDFVELAQSRQIPWRGPIEAAAGALERRRRLCAAASPLDPETGLPPRIDKSALTIAEPKRRRDRDHLRFVAANPCVACMRQPSQAHHLRFIQPRALGRKVSDEFTVPLCASCHQQLHLAGDERRWWRERGIDPAPIADRLWRASRDYGDAAE